MRPKSTTTPHEEATSSQALPLDPVRGAKADGYRGIWFTLGQDSEYGDKYSGGLGTYTANHTPLAVYAPEADKTFFVYGGTPGADQRHLQVMAGVYDHATPRVQRPTIVMDKGQDGVNDPHDNPSLSIDSEGHVWVFVAGRNTQRDGLLYRSLKPFSIDAFEEVKVWEGMTYPQPWLTEDGFAFFFTRYKSGNRRCLYFASSPDQGYTWLPEQELAAFEGHYQVSAHHSASGRIGTFFNYHPNSSVDQRTNLYYMESGDGGQTWTTVAGQPLTLPLLSAQNPALVVDYEKQGLRQYTCDLNWDADGNPLLLYIVSTQYQPGPTDPAREWHLTRWTGTDWVTSVITSTGHNYDMGSILIDGDRWTVAIPSGVGPQEWGSGGEVEIWTSETQGEKWTLERAVTSGSERNHGYIRRALGAADPFSFFWVDGNPDTLSPSNLYFGNRDGTRVWKLPYTMGDEWEEPGEAER